LRGINVGGKNLIKMAGLKACFEAQGFTDVRTYIQSGNVIFSTRESDQAHLESSLEVVLSDAFHYDSTVVVRSAGEIKDIVEHAPLGFGSEPPVYHYDVIFLKGSLTSLEAMQVSPQGGVDRLLPGLACYFSRLISRVSQGV
jgi:uncharacterized protein (DUF1697 family)